MKHISFKSNFFHGQKAVALLAVVFLSRLTHSHEHRLIYKELFDSIDLLFSLGRTYSVAIENRMPINDGLRVSVYISIPVPLR